MQGIKACLPGLLLLALSLMLVGQANAEDAAFNRGKELFQKNCLKCHNADLRPHKAPPMFMVQKHYNMAAGNRQAFIDRITAFATHPTDDKAIIRMAVSKLGLMPDQGFSEHVVRRIAGYIHDEHFAMPRGHMQGRSAAGGACSQKKAAAMRAHGAKAGEDGTLKAIMQQLGRDYAALDQAILMQDFAAAAGAAHNIAYHERPSLSEKMKIMATLRAEMSAFKKADGKVHGLARAIEQAARAEDMKLLVRRQSQMLGACMACHTSYRSKVMATLQ